MEFEKRLTTVLGFYSVAPLLSKTALIVRVEQLIS